MPDGTNGFFAQAEIASMTREGRRRRLLCPTGMPCRVVERDRWVWRRRPPLIVGGSLEGRGGRNVGELGATIGEVTLPVGAAVERRRGHGHGCHSMTV